MRESRTYGSVRGALSNGRPYRDQRHAGTTEMRNPPMSLRSSGPGSPFAIGLICCTPAIAFPLSPAGRAIAYEWPRRSRWFGIVMAGLVPAIHVSRSGVKSDVDARPKAGHDERSEHLPYGRFSYAIALSLAGEGRWVHSCERWMAAAFPRVHRALVGDCCVRFRVIS